jgi:hypothetical protein
MISLSGMFAGTIAAIVSIASTTDGRIEPQAARGWRRYK